ncbi:MAG: DoxX family protein [Maioricimonas sp. JB049]
MSTEEKSTSGKAHAAMVWSGRIISILLAALFGMSAVMKFMGGPDVAEGFAHLGLPESMRIPLGIVELACVVFYLIPQTAIIGAILLTGYVGGAICTHWRVGDIFVANVIIGVLVWLALWLREPRLRPLAPVRRL